MFLDILTANQIYQTERYKDVWGAEGISGRVKFLLLAWAGMTKTSFRKNSDSLEACLVVDSGCSRYSFHFKK
jgi:hypothetical protein